MRAHRALRDLGEQEFAQLGEQRRRQSQQSVRDEQRERHRQHGNPRIEAVDDAASSASARRRWRPWRAPGRRAPRRSRSAIAPTGRATACGSSASRRAACAARVVSAGSGVEVAWRIRIIKTVRRDVSASQRMSRTGERHESEKARSEARDSTTRVQRGPSEDTTKLSSRAASFSTGSSRRGQPERHHSSPPYRSSPIIARTMPYAIQRHRLGEAASGSPNPRAALAAIPASIIAQQLDAQLARQTRDRGRTRSPRATSGTSTDRCSTSRPLPSASR